MPLEPATALVLRTVDWSESSLVVTLFSREFGKIRGVAKGGRRPKGPFESSLDVLSRCRIIFLRKSSDALDVLSEAKLIERFRPFERGLPALQAGYHIAELLDAWTDCYDPHPQLYDLTIATLAELRPQTPLGALLLQFELAALRLLGYFPALKECVHCGAVVQPQSRVSFSCLEGGVLCVSCRPGKRNVISLSNAAWQIMSQLPLLWDDDQTTTEKEASDARQRKLDVDGLRRLPTDGLGELRPVVSQYVNHLLGFMPRTQASLGK